MTSVSERDKGHHQEQPIRLEMAVAHVNNEILYSGIPFSNQEQALHALQIPFANLMTAAYEATTTQGAWAFNPNTLSGATIKNVGDEHPLYVVSFQNPKTEAEIAQHLGIQRGLQHARVNIKFLNGEDGALSLNFDHILHVLNTAGTEIQLTGDDLANHFAMAAKRSWDTQSRISPSLTSEDDNLRVRIELGFGIVGADREKWVTKGSILQAPVHPLEDSYSLHISITPRESPTFDPLIIGRATNVTNTLASTFKAMQPQAA